MMYISTRGNYAPVTASQAISLGMVPQGGLFVPQSLPRLDPATWSGTPSYQQIARQVLELLLTDFTDSDLCECIGNAYNEATFATPQVIELVGFDEQHMIMELWHGPTAAFKDIALQIMPHLLACAKKKTGNRLHTAILVATSGDTGKAALEGFRNAPGISITVFYPHEGVSELQRLQMVTTDGSNTAVVAVRGNFDDCQNGVKQLFADPLLRAHLRAKGIDLSSANSINWGRLCPQIVYYVAAYAEAVRRGAVAPGDKVDFCVPTGNFGNILAGYYAKCMGLPIDKLICASNRNRVLADFFASGVYDCRREFFRTVSPSMDILVSSNLERFLFAVTGGDHQKIASWYESLGTTGTFTVDETIRNVIDEHIISGWVNEEQALGAIGAVYRKNGYVLDTHTAVAVALVNALPRRNRVTIIASTASPYKFAGDVLGALSPGGEPVDEFTALEQLAALSGTAVHPALCGLRERKVLHDLTISAEEMRQTVLDGIEPLCSPQSGG